VNTDSIQTQKDLNLQKQRIKKIEHNKRLIKRLISKLRE